MSARAQGWHAAGTSLVSPGRAVSTVCRCMTAIASSGRAARLARDWWPPVAFVALAIAIQTVCMSRYDASGHAAGHLGSATAIFPIVAVSAVLLWALPAPGRRRPLVWLALALLVAGGVVVAVGNVRVVDAIGGENWSDDQAGALGASRPGFESGHQLSDKGAFAAVAGSLVLAVVLWHHRLVSRKAAVVAAIVSVLVPYWIAPGFGIVVLAGAAVRSRHGERRVGGRRGELGAVGAHPG